MRHSFYSSTTDTSLKLQLKGTPLNIDSVKILYAWQLEYTIMSSTTKLKQLKHLIIIIYVYNYHGTFQLLFRESN